MRCRPTSPTPHPVTVGTTGQRSFATDTRGTIYFSNTGAASSPTGHGRRDAAPVSHGRAQGRIRQSTERDAARRAASRFSCPWRRRAIHTSLIAMSTTAAPHSLCCAPSRRARWPPARRAPTCTTACCRPDLHELLRRQRDRELHRGLLEPLRHVPRHPGGALRRHLVRVRGAAVDRRADGAPGRCAKACRATSSPARRWRSRWCSISGTRRSSS